jgi:hypothetical protein
MNYKLYIPKKVTMVLLAVFFSAIVFTVESCDSFVDIDKPNSQLTSDDVFENRATAVAAMTDIYAQMRDNGILTGNRTGVGYLLGNYTDELVAYETGPYSAESFYNNALLPSEPLTSALWNSAYNQIYATNAVITGVENSKTLSDADRKQLKGEALFVRALNHFYLVNLFGDIPYVTSTDYRINSRLIRTSVNEVNANIRHDLEIAIPLLTQNYVSTGRVRPNKAVAQSLLSRVYLYNNLWAEAANLASAVLNNESLYTLSPNLNEEFLKESKGTIWQFAPEYEGQNTAEAKAYIFRAGPPLSAALSNSLLNSFTSVDQRKKLWTRGVTNGTESWYHVYKYKNDTDSGTTTEYSIVFRIAEQYLIRAEARAHQGDLIGAKDDLDKIRKRAGLPLTTAQSDLEIIADIMEQRKLEFFTEYGHRFFDLKRTGKIDGALKNKTGWNNYASLWPIPQSELQTNPLITQNPGY